VKRAVVKQKQNLNFDPLTDPLKKRKGFDSQKKVQQSGVGFESSISALKFRFPEAGF
jgi:hypothetical protein